MRHYFVRQDIPFQKYFHTNSRMFYTYARYLPSPWYVLWFIAVETVGGPRSALENKLI
jgi:hypothetical protein